MRSNDLILKDNVLKGIEELQKSSWYNTGKEPNRDFPFPHLEYIARKEAVEIIRDLCIKQEPTVNAEPVVRCKDCWKCGYDNCPMDDWLDTHWIDNEFFCSLGEPYEMRPGLYRGVKMGRGEKYGKAD